MKRQDQAISHSRAARILHHEGRFTEAKAEYQEASDLLTGFAKSVALRSVKDCEHEKPFTGQIKGIHYQ